MTTATASAGRVKKATTTTPAKRERAAAPKPAATTAAPTAKLRWRVLGDGPNKAATVGDRTYSLVASEGKWMATLTEGGKTTTLIEGVGGGRAYRVAVTHFKTGELPQ